MAGYVPKLVDKGFQHWLKANFALNFTKDGIEDAVLNEINEVHQGALNDILTPEELQNNARCTQCTKQNILYCQTQGICKVIRGVCSFHDQTYYRPCPKLICDRMRDKIRKCHRHKSPSWKNTRTERWCQYPWEIAKCYFPPDGYSEANTIKETDLNGILSLLLNHTSFRNKVDERSCEEVREVGRGVRHSPNLCIDEQGLNNYLDTLVTFLNSCSLFQGDSKVTESVQKIQMLRTDSLTITTGDVTKVLQDVIQDNTRGSVEEINETAAQRASDIKLEVESISSKSLTDILVAKDTAISDIDRSKDTVMSDIDKSKNTAISDIDRSKDTAISDIDKSKDTAISDIDRSKDTVISDIDKSKDTAITDIDRSKDTTISDIDKSKDTVISDIDKSKDTTISDIDRSKDTAISDIVKSKDTVISDIDSSKGTAISDIDKSKVTAISDIDRSKDSAISDIDRSKDTAISDIDKSKTTSISVIDKNKVTVISDIDRSKDSAISDIDKSKDTAISDIDKSKTTSISDIDKNKDTAISDIDRSKDTAISDIDSSKETAISDIDKIKDTAISDIDKSKDNAISDIDQMKDTTISDIDISRDHAISYIDRTKDTAIFDIGKGKDNAICDIDRSKDTAISGIDRSKDTAISDIDRSKDTAISGIDRSKDTAISDIDRGKDTATADIDRSKDTAISHIDKSKHKAISDIDKSKVTAISDIDKRKDTAISDIEISRDNAISNIGRSKDAGISEIAKIKDSGVQDIKSAADQIKSEVLSDIKEMKQNTSTITDAVYQKLSDEFKEDLLTFNRENHSTIPISPLLKEHDTNIVGFYVPPAISCVELQTSKFRGPCSEVRRPVSDLTGVFYKNTNRCKNIFLTAKAGQGKTAFCKRLAIMWCNAHQCNRSERVHFTETDLRMMQEFEFLFLISLRDSSPTDCDIDNMIQNQIVKHLSRAGKYNAEVLLEILHRERHIVILDGLDEWTHPKQENADFRRKPEYLPHRKARENCTILTATRSWKFSIANLKSSQIDNHIEIGSLDQEALRQLINNTVTKIHLRQNTDDDISQNVEDISNEIRSRSIQELEVNPLILTYLVCLWAEGKPLGRSRCEIYANVLELLLLRAKEKYPDTSFIHTDEKLTLPVCFEARHNIESSYSFLVSLGRLAFEALLSSNKERSLVFEASFTKGKLTEKAFSFSLLTGLLIQSKVPGQLTSRDTRISFSHKTFQEFFAALYIQSQPDLSMVTEQVLKKCHNVENILEMSNVLMFLSGLSPEKASVLTEKFCNVINEDAVTLSYRQRNYLSFSESGQIKNLQNMYVACVRESKDNNHDSISLRLADLIIDKDIDNDEYFRMLQSLVIINIKYIRSVSLHHSTSERYTSDIITRLQLRDIHTLEMLCLLCPIVTHDMESLLTTSVHTLKQVYIVGVSWRNDHYINVNNVLSYASVNNIIKMNHLESLCLDGFKVSHSHLESLTSYLTNRTSMKEVQLYLITCTDHRQSCNGVSLDLSQHSQLENVGFHATPLSQLQINTSRLERCNVGELQKSSVVSTVLSNLPLARNLHNIACLGLDTALVTMLDTIPQLVHLKEIHMCQTDMRDRKLKLSRDMVNIERIFLSRTSMTGASFEELVQDVEQFQQSVRVQLENCTVTPTEEYERIKIYIKSSASFVVLFDGKNVGDLGVNCNVFCFKTIC